METQIEKMAKKILAVRERARLEAEEKKRQEMEAEEQKYLDAFRMEFADYLPMLEEAEIKVNALHTLRGIRDVFIRLSNKRGKSIEMEISLSGGYRYEHPMINGVYGRSTFSKWPKEDFVLFIYNGLIKEHDNLVDVPVIPNDFKEE